MVYSRLGVALVDDAAILWDEALPLLCTHFGVELVSLRVLDEHARFAQFTDVPHGRRFDWNERNA